MTITQSQSKATSSDSENSNDSHSSSRPNTTINSESSTPSKITGTRNFDSESDKEELSANKSFSRKRSDSESSNDSHSSSRPNTTINSESSTPSKIAGTQNSDSESDKEELSVNKSFSRKRSDSESSNDSHSSSRPNTTINSESSTPSKIAGTQNSDSESDKEELSINKSFSRKSSDSGNETGTNRRSSNDDNIGIPTPKSTGKFSLITESDLESDHDTGPPPGRLSSDSDFSSKPNKKVEKSKKKFSKNKKSKSDRVPESINSESENEERSSPKRPRKSDAKSSKSAKMSSKKEKDPLLSIRSETQRMIREGRISLPYHQPKQHTLLEFLQRRKAAPSIPLKASSDVLRTVCEQLSNKQKEVEEFYKSESDHSDTETQTNTLPSNTENENAPVGDETTSSSETPVEASKQNLELDSNEGEISQALENCEAANSNPEGTGSDAMELESHDESNKLAVPSVVENTSALEEDTRAESHSEEIPPNPVDELDTPGVSEDSKLAPENTESPSETEPKPTEDSPPLITDSVDFELRIEDDTDPTVVDSQTTDKSKKNQPLDSDAAITAPRENTVNTRLKRTLELLSNRSITLPSVKLNDIPVEIELEIETSVDKHYLEYEGVSDLKQKFVKHATAKNAPKKTTTQVNVVSTQKDTNGEITGITKETLVLNVDDPESEFSHPKFSKPGAKHAYLKEKILRNLISKKEANWNEYQNEKKRLYGYDSEEEKSDEGDEASFKKPDFEPYHPEDEPDDDELIEEDIIVGEKERKKNCFLDEEAEVSDLDEPDGDVDESAPEDNDDECDEDVDSLNDDQDSEDSDGLNIAADSSKPISKTEAVENSNKASFFKYNTTGSDLENKLLGLESLSQKDNESDDITASQVFGVCSGKFASQVVVPTSNADDDFFSESQNAEDSQNLCLTFPDTNDDLKNPENSTASSNRPEFLAECEAEEGSDNEELFVRKKRALRIEDSDDESNDAKDKDENSADEGEDEEEGEGEYDAVAAEELGYDSEEEMVPYTNKVAEEFFENEAELSESEWGSEDENERDLDKLEKEEGDDDDLDTEKLKEELGKIHMRQLLDDDQHDVRLLKEMLLEDGELHSDAKRQRKFQWKNLDGTDSFLKNFNDSDDENNLNDDDDDETEEHWRKLRHERETFLSQQEGKTVLTDMEGVESTFIQLSNNTKVVNESITKVIRKTTTSNTPAECKATGPSILSNTQFKCGSFLSRGKYLLSKLALSVTDSKENVNGAKNSRNFVFGAKSPEKTSVTERNEKRKSSGASVKITKKIKLSLDNGANTSKREGLLAQLTLLD